MQVSPFKTYDKTRTRTHQVEVENYMFEPPQIISNVHATTIIYVVTSVVMNVYPYTNQYFQICSLAYSKFKVNIIINYVYLRINSYKPQKFKSKTGKYL